MNNKNKLATAFTLSIDAAQDITTGISAADRVATIKAAIAEDAGPQDIVSPGHIFPLRARDGGVLLRAGHSEASVDLARMAGAQAAAIICEIMLPDGTMARLPDLVPYCKEHGLLLSSIADLIAYRERSESLVELLGHGPIHSEWGTVEAYLYRSTVSGEYHTAFVVGDELGPGKDIKDPVLVRVQQENIIGDVIPTADFPGHGCAAPMKQIVEHGSGVLVYIRDNVGRRLASYFKEHDGQIADQQFASTLMDPRQYGIGAQILRDLGVRKMRLISRKAQHRSALSGHGLDIVEHVPLDDSAE